MLSFTTTREEDKAPIIARIQPRPRTVRQHYVNLTPLWLSRHCGNYSPHARLDFWVRFDCYLDQMCQPEI